MNTNCIFDEAHAPISWRLNCIAGTRVLLGSRAWTSLGRRCVTWLLLYQTTDELPRLEGGSPVNIYSSIHKIFLLPFLFILLNRRKNLEEYAPISLFFG
jgi:hypothetical protein